MIDAGILVVGSWGGTSLNGGCHGSTFWYIILVVVRRNRMGGTIALVVLMIDGIILVAVSWGSFMGSACSMIL